MRWSRLTAAAVLTLALVAPAGPVVSARAAATPTPTPTPTGPVAVVAPGADPGGAATFPVEDFAAPAAEGYSFSSASADGAVTDTGDRSFRLSADVLFAFDRSALNARARREIARIAGVLKKQPDVARVLVTGYTDDAGSDSYNLGLSRRRAQAVRRALAAALGGVPVEAAGRGESGPIAENTSAAGRKLNRRVEIRVS